MADPHEARQGVSGRRNQHQQLVERAASHLASALEADGWDVSRSPPGPRAPDLLCRKGEQVYAVELKASVGKARRTILRALLADAILQSRVRAEQLEAQPLAVLVAPSLSVEIASELAEYVREFGGDVAWGALDDRGRFDLHGPGLDSVRPLRWSMLAEEELAYAPAPEQGVHNPFSDLGQWMLKILAAPHVPERWLHAPRRPVRGVSDLADQAGVSPASASRFLSVLEAGGHVARVDGAVRLARVEALLEAWRIASQRPHEERLARFLLPAPEPARRLREVLAAHSRRSQALSGEDPEDRSGARAGSPGRRVCLALFSACRELDVSFVRGAPIHIYAEDLSNGFLNDLELHPVEHRAEADLIVRRPRFPESVFRACVLVEDVPVADILQCWLDVSFHPARGVEQAEEIAKLLRPMEWSR